MDDLWFYILFSNISVISEWREIGNERLCAMELRFQLERLLWKIEQYAHPLLLLKIPLKFRWISASIC